MYTKVITGKNGSILGKIPIKMSEPTPQPVANHANDTNADRHAQRRRRPAMELEVTESQFLGAMRAFEDMAMDARAGRHRDRHHESRHREERRHHHEGRNPPRTDPEPQNFEAPDSARQLRNASLVKKYLDTEFLEENLDLNVPKLQVSADESFLPTPCITFLVDKPSLKCQICLETPLKMDTLSKDPKGDAPAILPCGHVSCYRCMKAALGGSKSCPFCRHDMKYPGCGHEVKATVLAMDTIATLPNTLARGGKIGHNCRACDEKKHVARTVRKWRDSANAFANARYEYDNESRKDRKLLLETAEDLFERIPKEFESDKSREKEW